MARLNPARIIARRSMSDDFWLIRQTETVNVLTGRSSVKQTRTKTYGVITVASPTSLMRSDSGQLMDRTISVVANLQLRGPSPGAQPDLVEWQGDQYIVQDVQPYPHFGVGFYQATAGILSTTNQP